MSGSHAVRTRGVILSLILDAALVVVFAIIGRASHQEGILGEGGLGLLTTTWPFLVGLGIGWAASLAWRRPLAVLRTGIPVWAVTVAGGMLLRAISGQGTAVAFIVVASVTLLAFLVGWRAIAAIVPTVDRRGGR